MNDNQQLIKDVAESLTVGLLTIPLNLLGLALIIALTPIVLLYKILKWVWS